MIEHYSGILGFKVLNLLTKQDWGSGMSPELLEALNNNAQVRLDARNTGCGGLDFTRLFPLKRSKLRRGRHADYEHQGK
jgi:hypothetical protein